MNKFLAFSLVALIAMALYLVLSGPDEPPVNSAVQPPAPAPSAVGAPPSPASAVGAVPSSRASVPPAKFGQAEAMIRAREAQRIAAGTGAGAPSDAAAVQSPGGQPSSNSSNSSPSSGKAYDPAATQSAMMNAMPALGACLEGGGSQVVTIDFEATGQGKAQSVRIGGAVPAVTERCLKEVMTRLRLPQFDGASQRLSFPVTVYQRQPAPARSSAAEQQPEPAPIVIQP